MKNVCASHGTQRRRLLWKFSTMLSGINGATHSQLPDATFELLEVTVELVDVAQGLRAPAAGLFEILTSACYNRKMASASLAVSTQARFHRPSCGHKYNTGVVKLPCLAFSCRTGMHNPDKEKKKSLKKTLHLMVPSRWQGFFARFRCLFAPHWP